MGLDIKLPIGLMFAIFGVILTVFGIMTVNDTELYKISLNININLWSGLIMLVFGGLMLVGAYITKKQKAE